ncbi:MAG TPA: NlpC/P60 family protein, partial [Gaiellaceae bacterium]|nr:NlpC/P60 family protein [Gaiellaceae bacterium]
MIRALKRQAPVLALACAAAAVAAGGASADTIGQKQAQARQVLAQIGVLDSSLERARTRYEIASTKLAAIERSLKINKVGLRTARLNLVASQKALMQRLVIIYQTRDQQASTLAIVLGASSISDLVNRIEAVHSVSAQDVAVMTQVITFKHLVTVHQHALVRAHRAQAELVRQRLDAKNAISYQLQKQQGLYNSIKGQIAGLIAAERARQLALARQAQHRLTAYEEAQRLQNPGFGVGAVGDGISVAPPSQYTGVVGVAMHYLGTPYVWGGSSPAGFDCSGFVAYVYGQMGVSLPHYTGAQWNVGVPVSRGDLQPGDLVFFDGLGHVGIYIGGGQFIHSPHTGDVVKISSLDESWYAATYDGARR